ncbi:hypothetical protein ACO2I3_16555 [Leptospira interrogans]
MRYGYSFAAWMIVLGTGAATAQVAAEKEVWQTVLRQVLASEKKCELREIQWVREVPVGGHIGLEGRIRCIDGREFDFTRARPHMKFEVQLCQPTVC